MENFQKGNDIKEKRRKYFFSMMFFVLLVAATFYLLLKDCDFNNILEAVKGAQYRYLILSFIMAIVYIMGEGQCINIIIKSLKGSANRFLCFIYGCIDFYFCAVTPSATGGQPIAAYYMSKDGVSVATSTIALLLNTIQYKLVLLVLGFAAVIFKFNIFLESFWFTFMFVFGIVANIITITLCLVAIFSKPLLDKVIYKIINGLVRIKLIKNRRKIIEKYKYQFKDYEKSAEYIKSNPIVNIKVFFVCLVQRVALFSIAYFVYKSFCPDGNVTFIDLLSIQVAVAMAVDSLPLPGGVGAAEAFTVQLYTIVYGPDLVPTATLLTRGMSYYLCVLVSGIFFIINHIRHSVRT